MSTAQSTFDSVLLESDERRALRVAVRELGRRYGRDYFMAAVRAGKHTDELWQEAGRLSVIADDGAVLEPYVSRRFLSLPLVVGKGADTQARDFLALLARYPQVNSITKAAIFVGERRWNLRLKDGLDIRLPEQDVGNALAMLSRLDKEDRLFSRDIVAVDLRLPDRLVVQLSEDAAKARDDLFKDKKKKKAGDAA